MLGLGCTLPHASKSQESRLFKVPYAFISLQAFAKRRIQILGSMPVFLWYSVSHFYVKTTAIPAQAYQTQENFVLH